MNINSFFIDVVLGVAVAFALKKKNSVCVNTAVFGKAGLEVEANCKINCATAVIIAANFLYFLSQFKRKFKRKVTDG